MIRQRQLLGSVSAVTQLPNLDLTIRAICARPMFIKQGRVVGLEDEEFDIGHAILSREKLISMSTIPFGQELVSVGY